MSEFRQWMQEAGFNAKEVSKAGAAIGVKTTVASYMSRGVRELMPVERLAMAAHLAGIKPWPEKNDVVSASRVAELEARIAELEAKVATDAAIVEKAYEMTDIVLQRATNRAEASIDAIEREAAIRAYGGA